MIIFLKYKNKGATYSSDSSLINSIFIPLTKQIKNPIEKPIIDGFIKSVIIIETLSFEYDRNNPRINPIIGPKITNPAIAPSTTPPSGFNSLKIDINEHTKIDKKNNSVKIAPMLFELFSRFIFLLSITKNNFHKLGITQYLSSKKPIAELMMNTPKEHRDPFFLAPEKKETKFVDAVMVLIFFGLFVL